MFFSDVYVKNALWEGLRAYFSREIALLLQNISLTLQANYFRTVSFRDFINPLKPKVWAVMRVDSRGRQPPPLIPDGN